MWGFDTYLPALRTAASRVQKAHMDGWEVAKTQVNAAVANSPAHFASATEWAKEATADGTAWAKEATADGAAWAREHPYKAAAYGTAGAVSLATVAVPGAVAAPVLALGGFGSNGIIGGSMAAGIQSGIGNVVAPSLFATCQSAAAGGYGVAAVNAVVQAGGAILAAGTGGVATLAARKNGKGEEGNGQGEGEEEDKKEDGEEETSQGAREEGTGQGPREEEKKKEDKMGCEEETTGATEGQEHARL